MKPAQALSSIPGGLREPLIAEFQSIMQNYYEHRWSPSELSGGKFCEIIYSILDGFARSSYPAAPKKPSDFPSACRSLESHSHVPRSFQILIPRSLPPLYEIRNQRGVGHVGGDVNPNGMDAAYVVAVCSWIMAELVRYFHTLSIVDAQALVDALAERKTPLIWEGDGVKRVLNPEMAMSDQILLLLGTVSGPIGADKLMRWLD